MKNSRNLRVCDYCGGLVPRSERRYTTAGLGDYTFAGYWCEACAVELAVSGWDVERFCDDHRPHFGRFGEKLRP